MYISLIAFYQFQSCPLIIQNVTRWYLVRLVHRGDIIICLALPHNIHLSACAHKVIKSLFTSISVCFFSSRFTSLPPIITTPGKLKKSSKKSTSILSNFEMALLWDSCVNHLIGLKWPLLNKSTDTYFLTIPLVIFQYHLLKISPSASRTTCLAIYIFVTKIHVRIRGILKNGSPFKVTETSIAYRVESA